MKKLLIIMSVFVFVSCSSNDMELSKIQDNTIVDKSNSYLKINPYGNAPLSAEIHLANQKEDITITVKGQDPNSDISYTWKSPSRKVFPVLGLYFDHTNTVVLETPSITKTLQVVITDKDPSIIEKIEVLVNNRPNSPERKNYLNFFNHVGKLKDFFATDDYGKIRWYFTSEHELHAMKFHYDSDEVTFSYINSATVEIPTYNMVGKHISTLKGPQTHAYNDVKKDAARFHHDMFYRDNGNVLVLDKSVHGVEDVILELDPKGNIVQEILIGDWIRQTVNGDPNDYTGFEHMIFDSENNTFDEYKGGTRYPGMPNTENGIDWAHINALSFDEATETIYLSFRQHGIFAFDYKNQKLKWIFLRDGYTIPAGVRDFYNYPAYIEYAYEIPSLAPYVLKGRGPDHPHAITFLSNNTFHVFDNSGDDGNFPEEGSRIMVFSVDEEKMIGHVDWEYRHKDTDGSLVYSQIVSDMDTTAFDTHIGVFGTQLPFTFIEVDKNKKVLFDIRLDIPSLGPSDSDIAMPIACPIGRLTQNGVFLYRGDYMPIYPSATYSID